MALDNTFYAFLALVIFLIIAARAGAFRTMAAGLDGRAARISKDLDDARKLREEAQALLDSYKQKRLEAEKEAAGIIAQAKADAEEYAAEARRKLSESLDRRSAQAELKIAQAEAAATKEVRARATDLAVAAAAALSAEATKGAKGADLVAQSIAAVKTRLN
jgi:F-type H+-transporting ATPase subunit b